MHCTHLRGSSIFSIIGLSAYWPGWIGVVGGALAIIGSSIIICCAPETTQDMMSAGVRDKFCAVRKSTQLDATPSPTRTPPEPLSRLPHITLRPACCSSSLASRSCS